MKLVPKGAGLPSTFGTGRSFGMQFSPNGKSSKLDFDDVQLMTVSEPEIKMAGHKPEAGMTNLGLSF